MIFSTLLSNEMIFITILVKAENGTESKKKKLSRGVEADEECSMNIWR